MNKQSEARRLADCLERDCKMNWPDYDNQMSAAKELRRLHARVVALEAAQQAAPAVPEEVVDLLRRYKKLCIEIGRGDSHHLGRIDAALAAQGGV